MVCKEYAGAVCRSKEKFLITDKEFDKLAGGSYADAKKFVIEKGFGKGAENGDDENLIREEEKNLFSFIKEYSPSVEFLRLSLIKNDYHNLNALIRKILFNAGGENALLERGYYSVETLESLINGKKASVSIEMEKAFSEIKKLFDGGEKSGAEVDRVIEKYKYAESLKLAKKNKRVLCSVKKYIDGLNVSTAIRSGSEEVTRKFFIDGGYIPLNKIVTIAGDDIDKDLLTGDTGELIKPALTAKKAGLPLIDFERTIESYNLSAFIKDKYVLSGYDLFYLYCRYKENEIKNVRILLVGLKCGSKKSEIIKRFRLNYGG